MLTIWGARQKDCDGMSRRGFLKVGTFGTALTLAHAAGLKAAPSSGARRTSKSAIMIFLTGGPSHLDTYDLKPEAPAEYRGEFKPITTNVSGIRVSELFPRQAAVMDKLALLRAVVSDEPGHGDNELVSGYNQVVNRNAHHPAIGAVVSRVLGVGSRGVPPSVSLRKMTFPTPLPEFEYDLQPGFLGLAHRPFIPTGPGLADLGLPGAIDWERLRDRRLLLARFDTLRRDLDASGALRGMDDLNRRAFEVMTSGALYRALDLSQEPTRVRDRYGPAKQFLIARRLIEAGVRFVSLAANGFWDTHSDNFNSLRRLCPMLDQAFSALIDDLHQRGLSEEVVVVCWGEFGRTPRINSGAGRDHWTPTMSAVVAGGGLKVGQVIGATDARGEQPLRQRYRVSQVLSTLYRAIGIDPAQKFPNRAGRPVYLLDDREPVAELL